MSRVPAAVEHALGDQVVCHRVEHVVRSLVDGKRALWPNRNSLLPNDIGISSTVISSPSIDSTTAIRPRRISHGSRTSFAGPITIQSPSSGPICWSAGAGSRPARSKRMRKRQSPPVASSSASSEQRRAARDTAIDRKREQREQPLQLRVVLDVEELEQHVGEPSARLPLGARRLGKPDRLLRRRSGCGP